jgi:hypothetical protein
MAYKSNLLSFLLCLKHCCVHIFLLQQNAIMMFDWQQVCYVYTHMYEFMHMII